MFNFRTTCLILSLLIAFTAKAQERRVFTLKQGDEFQREILASSRSVIQRGKQTLDVSAVSSLTKSYVVSTASPNGNVFDVKINKMDNVIDALGKRINFSSETKRDSSSSINNALYYMLNKPVSVNVDKNGVIVASNMYTSEMASDTLVAFAGIEPEVFERGTLLSLFADVTYSPNLKKGVKWADSVQINGQTLHTTFTVEDVNERNTIVKFSSSIISTMTNSNSNGTFIIDNKTGLIVEKLIYTVSMGYQLSAGKTIYAVSRSTSISEKVKQITK